MADLYDTDFYAWTKEQADALRRRADPTALEFDRIAEEIEDLGASQYRACRSAILRILEHFLKLQFVPMREPRQHWRGEIIAFRADLESDLTPSIERRLRLEMDRLYGLALKRTRGRLLGQKVSAQFPETSPYTWDDIIGRGEDWTPQPEPHVA